MGCISSILALNREAGNVLTGEMTALAMERGDGASIIIKFSSYARCRDARP